MADITDRTKNFEGFVLDSNPLGKAKLLISINSKVEYDTGLRGEGGHHHTETDAEVRAPHRQRGQLFIIQCGSRYTFS